MPCFDVFTPDFVHAIDSVITIQKEKVEQKLKKKQKSGEKVGFQVKFKVFG